VTDDSKKIIYSFFWLATGKEQMRKVDQTEKVKCVDPDGEQLVFWQIMLDADPRIELTLHISPFVKFDEWDELLVRKPRIKGNVRLKCLEDSLRGEALDKKWSLIPAIFGINSCYEPQERKSAIRFSLLGCCGEEILEQILLTILETLFAQCGNCQVNAQVKEIMDIFISGLKNEYPFDEELNGCIRNRYVRIRDQLKESFPNEYNKNYERLQNDWEDYVEKARSCEDVVEYYVKMFPNYRRIFHLLYLIQEICIMAGCRCELPDEFSEENLKRKVGLIPEKIKNMKALYEEISGIKDLDRQKEITDEIFSHIHNRRMDWDRSMINNLLERARGGRITGG